MVKPGEPPPITLDDRRALAGWAADCAERALPVFEAAAPEDNRPREALAGAREYATDGKRKARLRTLAAGAYAAARETKDLAAAARAAGHAVAVAFLHDTMTKHQGNHILGPPVYAALALELASGRTEAGDEAVAWAARHAPPGATTLMRCLPNRKPGKTRLAALHETLDSALRG